MRTFRAGFLFCGLGAGARGFIDAAANLGRDGARFESVGGVDNDPAACADFEYLTKSPATCADISKMTTADLRAAMGDEAPDCIFMSAPCKGFSGLLSAKQSMAPKYQALNQLVFQGMFLICETWAKPPGLIVFENVPRIRTRGKNLLLKASVLLQQYGYVFHEDTHECGELGGLGQIRRRYLLVARHPDLVPAYIYRPPKQRVKACGEVLRQLPIPGAPAAGLLHQLPRISWLNWLRLALIPAGGDWRDLPGMAPKDPEARRRWEREGVKTEGGIHKFNGAHGVMPYDQPARSVIGGPSNGAANVADSISVDRMAGSMGVTPWDEPSRTIVGESYPSNGSASVADPRLPVEAFGNVDRVTPWEYPVGTITASPAPSSGAGAVADPRLPVAASRDAARGVAYGVTPWGLPAAAVTGSVSVAGSNTPGAVADPRVPLGCAPRPGSFGVEVWDEPSAAVTGSMSVSRSNTPAAIADPRAPSIAYGGDPENRHANILAVGDWSDPAKTVTGASRPSGGAASVADPRIPELENPVPDGAERRSVFARHDVGDWNQPSRTVAGSGTNGACNVADPRAEEIAGAIAMNRGPAWGRENKPHLMGINDWGKPATTVVGKASVSGGNARAAVADPRATDLADNPTRHRNKYAVGDWQDPSATVTGSTRPGSGAPSVADPRVALDHEPRRGSYDVVDWRDPARTVRGVSRPANGGAAVADPRGLGCSPRAGVYGVLSWQQAAHAITGNARIDNGSFAIGDPRGAELPPELVIRDPKKDKPDFIPVIISEDGTWHRPLTTLELAALQGLPAKVDGEPLRLSGKAVGKWRERIGNAVPVQAAQAIAETLLLALLAAALKTWTLGSTGIWVRQDGVTEDEALVEMGDAA